MDYGAATLDRIVSSVWRTDDFGRLMAQLLLARLDRPVHDPLPELATTRRDSPGIVLGVELVVRDSA